MGVPAVRRRLAASVAAVDSTWRNPDLRRAQVGFAGAWTAEWAFTVGVGVYAYRDGGATAVGVLALVRMLAAATAAPVMTPYADRWRRDRVLAGVSLARALATGMAALLSDLAGAHIGVYAFAVASAVAAVMFRPVHSALLPSLCRTPRELGSANVVRGMLDAGSMLVGPVLAAVFLSHGGVPAVFGFAAATSAGSALLLLSLHPQSAASEQRGSQLAERLIDGLRVVRRNGDLGLLIGLAALQTVMRGAIGVFVVVLALHVLNTGAPGVGTLTAAIGAGAVIGSLVTTLLVGTRRLARWFGVGVALWGLPLTLLAARATRIDATVCLAVVGAGNALVDIGLFTLIARRAPDEVLAAVFGVLESAIAVGVAVGSLLAPLLIHLAGTRNALLVIGTLSPVGVALAWRQLAALDVTVTHQDREIEVLRAVPSFALLPLLVVEQLARSLEPVTVNAGDVVVAQGDPGDRYFLIESGSAEVLGDDVTITQLKPGDGFGEIALLRRVPRTATVRALTELHLLSLSSDRFLAALTLYPPSAAAVSAQAEQLLRRYTPKA